MNTLSSSIRHFQNRATRVAVTYQPFVPRVAVLLAVICALSMFLYGIFLLEAVGQTAMRTSSERQIRELSSQLATLEGQYLAATKELTPEKARELGYVTPAKVSTVVVDKASFTFAH